MRKLGDLLRTEEDENHKENDENLSSADILKHGVLSAKVLRAECPVRNRAKNLVRRRGH
jgi:hypothetical protein